MKKKLKEIYKILEKQKNRQVTNFKNKLFLIMAFSKSEGWVLYIFLFCMFAEYGLFNNSAINKYLERKDNSKVRVWVVIFIAYLINTYFSSVLTNISYKIIEKLACDTKQETSQKEE